MCGVAGFFYFKGTGHSSEPLMRSMLSAIKHRGPDGDGVLAADWYALGHVRLSILDVSELGHQPMFSSDGRYALVYNGEIYNYLTLRRDLEERGYHFRSHGDSEVLLNGLIAYGPVFLERLEGMFAGAFMDMQTGECLVFRDHLGIKPLYYVQDKSRLAFASEVKALWPFWGSPSLNEEALYEQFKFRTVSGERTLYQDVKRLLPGHYLKITRSGAATPHQYYDITDHIVDHPKDVIDIHKIQELIDQSIHAHTISDVGYAVQLSGGIDSTYVTHVLSRDKPDLEAYSISLPGLGEDEAQYQNMAAQLCGVKLHQYPCTANDFAALLPEVTGYHDFPVMHGGSVFLYALCQKISLCHKVVLTGEGADELFSGYSRYQISNAEKMAFFLKRMGLPAAAIPDWPKLRGLAKLMRRDLGADASAFDMHAMSELSFARGDAPYYREKSGHLKTLLGRMMAVDQTAYLGSLLERQDKISMAHGVEVRVPFCNHKLFEIFNRLRHTQKTVPTLKAPLKALLAKHFPQNFVYRRKNGFALPFAEWLRDGKGLGRYLDYLTDDRFKAYGFIHHENLKRRVDEHRKGAADHSKELLLLMMFAVWARQAHV